MSNNVKIVIIILGLFLYLFVKIVHDRMYLEYGRLRRSEMKLTIQEERHKSVCDSLKSYKNISRIAKGKLNMVFPSGRDKKVIE